MKGNEHEARELIDSYRTAILTTRGPDGHFHTRPMAVQRGTGLDELWFATSVDARKVHDLEENPECAVSMHEGPRDASYVSISGHGSVVRDREKIHEVWQQDWKEWFPDGPDQADLALIRVTPEHVEYVHPSGGRLFSSVRSALSRHREGPPPRKELELEPRTGGTPSADVGPGV